MLSSLPIIQNVVSTCSLRTNGQKLDLRQITLRLPNTEYRPQRFSAMILRIKEPLYAAALLFSTGRLVCVGTKSVADSHAAITHIAQLIANVARLSTDDATMEFTVRNMVASFCMPAKINLPGKRAKKLTTHPRAGLYNALRAPKKPDWLQHCSYCAELFPGMCLRLKNREGIVILVFSSGKCVITGTHSEQEIQDAFQTVYATLEKHMCEQ